MNTLSTVLLVLGTCSLFVAFTLALCGVNTTKQEKDYSRLIIICAFALGVGEILASIVLYLIKG